MNSYITASKQYLLSLKNIVTNGRIDYYEVEKLKKTQAKLTLAFLVSELLLRSFFPDFFLVPVNILVILMWLSLLVEIYLAIRF